MSRYVPKIFLGPTKDELHPTHPEYERVSSEVRDYSITPRTLAEVHIFTKPTDDSEAERSSNGYNSYIGTLPAPAGGASAAAASAAGVASGTTSFQFPTEIETLLSEHQGYIFREKYSYMSDEVSRFGITTSPYDHILTSSAPVASAAPTGSSSSTASSGSRSSAKWKKSVELHPIEKCAIFYAIREIESSKDSKNVAIVDIYERDPSSGVIREESQTAAGAAKKYKIHSIVLKKTTDGKLLVIDPSNSTFSEHLTCFNNDLTKLGYPLITIPPKIQIYKPLDRKKPSYAPDAPRDCTDIAVKIALRMKDEELGSGANLKEHKFITLISNTDVDSSSIWAHTQPPRLKQSSSFKASITFQKLQILIGNSIKLLEEAKFDTTSLVDRYKDIIKEPNGILMLRQLNDLKDEVLSVSDGIRDFELECAGNHFQY